jgi:hypothetical protein
MLGSSDIAFGVSMVVVFGTTTPLFMVNGTSRVSVMPTGTVPTFVAASLPWTAIAGRGFASSGAPPGRT